MKYSEKQILLMGLGAVVILLNLFFSGSNFEEPSSELASFSGGSESAFSNPEFSFWEEMLCTGYKTAWYCPDKPLHPYVKHYEDRGVYQPLPEKPKRVTTFKHSNLAGG